MPPIMDARLASREVRKRGSASRKVNAPEFTIDPAAVRRALSSPQQTTTASMAMSTPVRKQKKSPVLGLHSALNRDPKSPKRVSVPMQTYSPSWEATPKRSTPKRKSATPLQKSKPAAKPASKPTKMTKVNRATKVNRISKVAKPIPKKKVKDAPQVNRVAKVVKAVAPKVAKPAKGNTKPDLVEVPDTPDIEEVDPQSMEINYERLSASSKITTVDVLIEIVKDYLARNAKQSPLTEKFRTEIVNYFGKLQDVRMTNESLSQQIQKANKKKHELRSAIYDLRKREQDVAAKLNAEREHYHEAKNASLIRKRIEVALYDKEFSHSVHGRVRSRMAELPNVDLGQILKSTSDKLERVSGLL